MAKEIGDIINVDSALKGITLNYQTLRASSFIDVASASLDIHSHHKEPLLDVYVEVDAATMRPVAYIRTKNNLEGEPTIAYWLDTGEVRR